MYDGPTGRKLAHPCAIGLLNVLRLKHFASDKIHARAHGRYLAIVKQPVEGRSREGGLRFGEMERDAVLGHGASFLLVDRLFECSDAQLMLYCPTCSEFVERDASGQGWCRYCANQEAAGLLLPAQKHPVVELALPQAAFIFSKYVTCLGMQLKYDTQ